MFISPPDLLIVLLAVGLFMVLGALVFGGSPGATGRERGICGISGCGHRNIPQARYCGRCGRRLNTS